MTTKELTGFGEAIAVTEGNDVTLDKLIKMLFTFKPLLAHIFKETVIECADMGFDEIERCIEGEAQVESVGLNPGTTNGDRIEGRAQEDSVYGEGTVTYDIRTVIRIPDGTELGVKLLIDLEAQRKDTFGYDLAERGIFYGSRMISAQLSTEFSNSSADDVKYGNLKKVYSIWICTEVPHKRANTIERINLQHSVYPEERAGDICRRYDLMEVVIVNISKSRNSDGAKSEMIRLLTDLFDTRKKPQEKIVLLKDQYGIDTTQEFERKVGKMTAYTASLLETGRAEGVMQTVVKFVLDEKISVSEGAKEVGMTEEDFRKLLEEAKANAKK